MKNITPFPPNKQQREQIVNFTQPVQAINHLLTTTSCPDKLRGFIFALIGIIGTRCQEWIDVDDLTVANTAGAFKGSELAAKKWTQRQRKAVMVWNSKTRLEIILCRPGGRTEQGLHYCSSYQLPIVALALQIEEHASNSQLKNRHEAFSKATRLALAGYKPLSQPNFGKRRTLEDPNEIVAAVLPSLLKAAAQHEQGIIDGLNTPLFDNISSTIRRLR